jgi:hypothetical protein
MYKRKRLTTDTPSNNFETAMNYVFDKDREAFIRHDGRTDNVPLWQYIDRLCEERGCEIESPQDSEQTDWRCCDCAMDGEACPISMMYTFASQAVQLRGRLIEYENADDHGKLLRLPCKRGDICYEVDQSHGVITHTVTGMTMYNRKADGQRYINDIDNIITIDTWAVGDDGCEWPDHYTVEEWENAPKTRKVAEAAPKGGVDGDN